MSFTYLQMILKALGLDFSPSVWKSRHCTTSHRRQGVRFLCKRLKIVKRRKTIVYLYPPLYPRVSPWAQLQCEGRLPNPNAAIYERTRGSKSPSDSRSSSNGVKYRNSLQRPVMSLYKLWPRPSSIQQAASPSFVWKASMTEEDSNWSLPFNQQEHKIGVHEGVFGGNIWSNK